jgi:hypothetical protein
MKRQGRVAEQRTSVALTATLIAVGATVLGLGGCVSTTVETYSVSCSEYIGRPISERIAALGPPKSVYRISSTQVGYVFETADTTLIGGDPFYTVNYMIGVKEHRTPIHPITTTCRGMFIVKAASDALPVTQRIIVDVR